MSLPDRPSARVICAAEADVWQDGFAVLARAQQDAQALRDTVDAEIAAARARGHAEGRAQGEAEAAALLLQTQAQVGAYLERLEPRLADLVFQILHAVLIDTPDPALIANATRRALPAFRETETITLSVPEAHLAEVEAQLSGLNLRIAPDRHLTGHQCILTSPVSSIDISLDAQLAAIRAAMG